ncbi:hypothetical protein cyc_04332 [Cyclospora cayetanensis]|uniref:Cyclic nucleotide-binding domain-containing protein n=1 Tax=Cyclospora cayetanensis TaxID=88456 RepID=A0A1D3D644_9EIME|nr:hypothetical protein cyc_04332 [Cyclospora cayetanensis]
MIAGWVERSPSLEPSVSCKDVADNVAEVPSSGPDNAGVDLEPWGPHPSRVGQGSQEHAWVSEVRREPRRSCIVSTGADRSLGSQHVRVSTLNERRESKIRPGSTRLPDRLQSTLNHAISYAKAGGRKSRRSTPARSSVMASIPTFDIREPTTPATAKELRRIYQLEEPVDENVWSYLSWIAKLVGIFLCIISLWTLWFAPFLAAFANVYPVCQHLLYLDVALDLLYIAGVALEFNISVIDLERRTEIQHRGTIIEIHLNSPTFYGDLISCMISPLLLNGSLRQSSFLLLILAKYFRFHRLLWLPHCMDRIRRNPWFQVIWLVIVLVLVNHVVGCIYFMIIESQGLWDRHVAVLDPPIDEYTFSYTYGINMIHAQVAKADILSFEELLLYCIVAPVGTLISAMAFGEITVLYQRLNLLEGQHSDDMAFSLEAMRILRVPPEMQKRVDQYFRYVHSSRDTFALTKLMSSLNDPLLEELKLHLYKGLVSKAKFFKACPLWFSRWSKLPCHELKFTKHVVMRLQDKIYSPGDYIIRAGQEGDCMFFIIKGNVEVLSADGKVIMIKSGGDYFGELALLTVAEHFDEVLVRFPHELRNAFRGFDLMGGADLDTAFEQARRRIHYRYKLLRGWDLPDLMAPQHVE